MERGEASCAKRARLLFPNQNDTDSDSDDAYYTACSTVGEEVEPPPSLPGSPSSHFPKSSPDFSASTSEDEESVQDVAGQQPPSPLPPMGCGTTSPEPPKGKAVNQHILL
jgi:hypothetical protein